MRVKIQGDYISLWLSANDTWEWANRPDARWPCSQLRGKRVFAQFDRCGLVAVSINGRDTDCDATEFNAITSDFLAPRVPHDHPARFVTVSQFQRD